MSIYVQLKKACKENKLNKISFIRLSYFENEPTAISTMKEQVISLVEQLSNGKLTDVHELVNQQTTLISGRLDKKGLFNISLAVTKVASPILKVELVGEHVMIQLDTSTDSAFGGTYHGSLVTHFH
ncbi:hypothetical protein IGI37_002179 [Enterococcus sp. AZ194]|uniref:hypothetical protein n=1 Tax=Enterococcus sp. AZ194 TaxID=2774629 RepID=UPI003F254DD8